MLRNSDKTVKPNSQCKLRLKRTNSDSTQNTIVSNENNVFENTVANINSCTNKKQLLYNENELQSSKVEDSLADFKSPKQENTRRPIFNKFKIDAEKTKKKILNIKNKPTKSRRSSSDINQPSIESSFFKSNTLNQNDIQESIPCPLCLKPFKDDVTCTNHMKLCASKNKVSIKQLLEAKQLQDRQAEERKAMGLLAAPVLSNKKKLFRSKNFSTGDDPQLQLVLAMSESLHQAEQIEQFEQAALLAGIPVECVQGMNDEERKTTLQNFGFTTNKAMSEVSIPKSKKRKLYGPTVLQTRSREDKDRVLTERIACILTGDDALTQVEKKTEIISKESTPIFLRSKILKGIEQLSNRLWDKTRLTKNYDFYVEEFKSQILQSNELQKTKAIDCRSLLNQIHNDYENEVLMSDNTIVYEPMELDVLINQSIQISNSNLSTASATESENMNYELDSMKNLVLKWGEALNDSAVSDIIIFVKNNKHIYAHKIVFHVQCSNILLDLEMNDTQILPQIKQKINWLDKDQLSALAFLEFIYCGFISKNIQIFQNENLLSEVKNLARFYRVEELFSYIRKKRSQISSTNIIKSQIINSNITDRKEKQDYLTIEHLPLEVTEKDNNDCSDRRITASPDIFESENEEETIYSCKTQENSDNEASANNSNLKVLMDLINEDENENNQSEKTSTANEMSSQQTVVNLSGTPSPKINESLDFSPQEDIHEAVTPKSKRSPERADSITPYNMTPQNINFDKEQSSGVVTPKYRRSPEKYDDIMSETNMHKNKQIYEDVPPSNKKKSNSTSEKLHDENNEISEAVTPESNVHSRLSDYITPKKVVYTNIEVNTHDNAEKDYDLMHNVVTPPKSDSTQFDELNEKNIQKLKTDLSLFIDKVRRQNARSLLETDSEPNTPEFRDKPKNPFLKKYKDDSYAYLRSSGNKNKDDRRVISMLEKDVLDGCNQITTDKTKYDPTDSKLSTKCVENLLLSDDEIEDITVNETNMSMYSKYKKANKHNNSIEKYRNQLNFDNSQAKIKLNHKQNIPNTSTNFLKKPILQNKTQIRSNSEQADITLVSDSDDEQQSNCKLTSNKKNDYNQSSFTTQLKKQNDVITSSKDIGISNIEDDSAFSFGSIHDELKVPSSTKIGNSTSLQDNSKNTVIDLSLDSDEESICSNNPFPKNLAVESDNSRKMKKYESNEFNDSKKKKQQLFDKAEKRNDEVDAVINEILQSNSEYQNRRACSLKESTKANSQEKLHQNVAKPIDANDSECEEINLSPISITSSPEIYEKNSEKNAHLKSCIEKHVKASNSKKFDSVGNRKMTVLDAIDNEFLDDLKLNDNWNRKSYLRESHIQSQPNLSKQTRNESNTSKRQLSFENNLLDYDSSPISKLPTLQSEQMSSLISSPILIQNNKNSQINNPSCSKTINSILTESATQISKETIKLKTKSASASNLTKEVCTIGKSSLQRSSSCVTPEQNKSLLKRSSKYKEDVTPPVDYSRLGTPELQKELKKYGLKPQNREKAKLLLRHIYDETHPMIPVSKKRISNSTTSSEDEDEPPLKRKNITKCKDSALQKKCDKMTVINSKNSPVIAEEMNYDEPDVIDASENLMSIKDAFNKLIETNKELYTKVLTYEPLSLENVHLQLKEIGFKCKINNLMDFLDEQCITFQIQSTKGNRLKKKI